MYILSFEIMQRAFLAGIVTALLASVMGVFVVLRRMSMVGDSLSHAALAGVAGSLLFGIYPFYGTLIFTVIAAVFIEFVRSAFKKYSEVALAVIMSGGMGLAVVLISLGRSFNADLMSYLFGSLAAVSKRDVLIISITGFFIIISVILLYRELFSVTFDEEAAATSGIPVGLINTYFTILTALVVALSIRIVGALLISALMVMPAAVSIQLAKSFKSTFLIAIAVSLFSVITGLYLSFIFDLAPGGTIVLLATGILIIAVLIKGALRSWK